MRCPCRAGFRGRSIVSLLAVICGMVMLSACLPAPLPVVKKTSHISKKASAPCQPGHRVGYLHTFHAGLVDASGCQVQLKVVNWTGFESDTFDPHGLGGRNWHDMLNQIAQIGFNTIRLPFSNQLFDPGSKPQGINYQLNPDLKGLKGLALMDRIIQGAARLGLMVILDRHDSTADNRTALWYTDQVPRRAGYRIGSC